MCSEWKWPINKNFRSQANEESFFPGSVSILASEASARVHGPVLLWRCFGRSQEQRAEDVEPGDCKLIGIGEGGSAI